MRKGIVRILVIFLVVVVGISAVYQASGADPIEGVHNLFDSLTDLTGSTTRGLVWADNISIGVPTRVWMEERSDGSLRKVIHQTLSRPVTVTLTSDNSIRPGLAFKVVLQTGRYNYGSKVVRTPSENSPFWNPPNVLVGVGSRCAGGPCQLVWYIPEVDPGIAGGKGFDVDISQVE